MTWLLYTDGGAAPTNPGPSAWGAVLTHPDGRAEEFNDFLGRGTNQIAEMSGALFMLQALPEGAEVLLFTDSQYVVKGLAEWRAGWQRRGWRNSEGKPVANLTLWHALFAAFDARQVAARWVRGHSGDPMNERADRLVAEAIAAQGATRSSVARLKASCACA